MERLFLKNHTLFLFFFLLSCNHFCNAMSQPVLSLESMEKAKEAGARAWKELVTTPTNFHLETSCWETALQKFKAFSGNCGSSNESVKIILALVLTECHMRPRLISFPTYTCRLDDLFSNDVTSDSHVLFSVNAWKETWSRPCLSALSETAFSVYVQFFNHIDNICFYLQSTAWQEKTEETVILLSETSHKVVTQLHQAEIRNEMLLEKQVQALEFQKDLSQRSEQLQKALDVGHSSLQASLAGMHQQIYNEQQKLLSGFKELTNLFQRVLRFQQYVTNWLFGAQGVSIYVLLIILTYYMTTALSTRSCRGKLYALWTIMFCLEILTYRWSQMFFSNSRDFIIKAIGTIRTSCVLIGIMNWFCTWWKYCDANTTMFQLFRSEIQELKNHLERRNPTCFTLGEPYNTFINGDAYVEDECDEDSDACVNEDTSLSSSEDISCLTSDTLSLEDIPCMSGAIQLPRRNPHREARPQAYRAPITHYDFKTLRLNPKLLFETPQDFSQQVMENSKNFCFSKKEDNYEKKKNSVMFQVENVMQRK